MSCLKFSFLLLTLISVDVMAVEKFTSQQCLDAKFEAQIEHQGSFFGLLKKKLAIKKDRCILEITYKNLLPTAWVIDICREPIHMKVTLRGTQDVYKRGTGCTTGIKSEYCGIWNELKETMQDYGLIYAEGEREFLNQAHGQVYCSYLLLKKYLEQGVLFSSYDKAPDIYENQTSNDLSEKNKSSWSALPMNNPVQKDIAPTDTSEKSKDLGASEIKKDSAIPSAEGRF